MTWQVTPPWSEENDDCPVTRAELYMFPNTVHSIIRDNVGKGGRLRIIQKHVLLGQEQKLQLKF